MVKYRITKAGHDQATRQAARDTWPGFFVVTDEKKFLAELRAFADLAMIDNPATWLANAILKGGTLSEYNRYDDTKWAKIVRAPHAFDEKAMAAHQEVCGRKLFAILSRHKKNRWTWRQRNRRHAAELRRRARLSSPQSSSPS